MFSSQRPAKRQRRSTLELSDNEKVLDIPDLPVRELSERNGKNKSKAKQASGRILNTSTKTSSARSSPKSSPEKTRKSTKKLSVDESQNKSINSFFSKATEEQRWRKKSATTDFLTETTELADDTIDDEISDDDISYPVSRSETIPRNTAAKTSLTVPDVLSTRQRFRKVPVPVSSPSTARLSEDQEDGHNYKPWADRYGPANLDELAVHKKKVQDVRNWLNDAVTGRSSQRLLVLKGSAGTGKSSTIRALAKASGLGLVEWQNPNVAEIGTMSTVVQFADFVSRGARYGILELDKMEPVKPSVSTEQAVLLVEEFPASAMRFGGGLDAFRTVLQTYLAAAQSPNTFGAKEVVASSPIVLVISETLVNSSTALTDSFTAHRLLGPELTHNPNVTIIEFNPVAPTFISKALELVIRKEARDSGRRRVPGPAVLQKLTEVGDIRSAINSLEFLCSRGDDSVGWSGTVAGSSKRNSKTAHHLSEMEENSIKLIGQRESTLDMFHATGKVVYNKREDPQIADSNACPLPKPPDYLMHHYRPKVSQVDIESLLSETGTDIQTFISTLHENYVLSCNHDDFVDYFEQCSHHLSDSELLNPDTRRQVRGRGVGRVIQANFQTGTTDALRQDEISFQLATRGLLFSLPFPVSRATPPGARRADSFKMAYPTGLRVWKPTEETRDLVELQTKRMFGASSAEILGSKSDGGIASWKSRAFDAAPALGYEDSDATPARMDINKENLVLETFPYLAQIRTARHEDTGLLNKISRLRGLQVTAEDPFAEESEELVGVVSNLTQRVEAAHSTLKMRHSSSSSGLSPRKDKTSMRTEQVSKDELAIQTLYIEEDDIVDD